MRPGRPMGQTQRPSPHLQPVALLPERLPFAWTYTLTLPNSRGETFTLLYEKNASRVTPIASITKLMMAIVTLEAKLPLTDLVTVSDADIDDLKGTTVFLKPWHHLAARSHAAPSFDVVRESGRGVSEPLLPGRAAGFHCRDEPQSTGTGYGQQPLVSPNGLSPADVSTARDLVRLVKAACRYPLIRQFSTDTQFEVYVGKLGRVRLRYGNTDRLVGREDWEIELQKTGFINESGRCLVMDTQVDGRNLILVFLDAYGRLTCFADARRVRRQLAALERRR